MKKIIRPLLLTVVAWNAHTTIASEKAQLIVIPAMHSNPKYDPASLSDIFNPHAYEISSISPTPQTTAWLVERKYKNGIEKYIQKLITKHPNRKIVIHASGDSVPLALHCIAANPRNIKGIILEDTKLPRCDLFTGMTIFGSNFLSDVAKKIPNDIPVIVITTAADNNKAAMDDEIDTYTSLVVDRTFNALENNTFLISTMWPNAIYYNHPIINSLHTILAKYDLPNSLSSPAAELNVKTFQPIPNAVATDHLKNTYAHETKQYFVNLMLKTALGGLLLCILYKTWTAVDTLIPSTYTHK